MDLNANLEEALRLAASIQESDEASVVDLVDAARLLDDAARLAELILALDGWISRWGFLPRRWHEAQKERRV